eukprot:2177853-Amphidinium_carterae.1
MKTTDARKALNIRPIPSPNLQTLPTGYSADANFAGPCGFFLRRALYWVVFKRFDKLLRT